MLEVSCDLDSTKNKMIININSKCEEYQKSCGMARWMTVGSRTHNMMNQRFTVVLSIYQAHRTFVGISRLSIFCCCFTVIALCCFVISSTIFWRYFYAFFYLPLSVIVYCPKYWIFLWGKKPRRRKNLIFAHNCLFTFFVAESISQQ